MNINNKHTAGFTLLELIIVIIITSILAVSVVPKFIGVSSFDAYAYRDQMISSLRLMQQQAMQDTRENICHQIVVSNNGYGAAKDCVSHVLVDDWQKQNTGFAIPADSSATINFNGQLTFDSWGRVAECSALCEIDFNSEGQATLCIESQGYIHAC